MTDVFRSIVYHIRQLLHFIPSEVTQYMGIGACCLLNVGVSKKTLHNPNVHLIFGPSGGECVMLYHLQNCGSTCSEICKQLLLFPNPQ